MHRLMPTNRRFIRPYDKPSFEHTQRWGINWKHPLAKGLVGCWVMNEGSGNKIFDSIRNNHGDFVGTSISWTSQGLDFSGDNNNHRIDLGSIPSSNPLNCSNSNAVSIFSRIFVNSGGLSNTYPRVIDKSTGGVAQNGYALWFDTAAGLLQFYVDESSPAALSSSVLSRATWYNVLITKGTSGQDFYIDGLPDTNNANDPTIPSTTTNAAIGNWNHSTDRNWDGKIAFVFVWNRKLTTGEAAFLHRELYGVFKQSGRSKYYFVPAAAGDVCWGHDNGVVEPWIRDFQGNWTGTGSISGAGDNEIMTFDYETGNMVSETWNIGAGQCWITYDKYQIGKGIPTIEYKTGATEATCEADSWHVYNAVSGFTSLNWIKIRLT